MEGRTEGVGVGDEGMVTEVDSKDEPSPEHEGENGPEGSVESENDDAANRNEAHAAREAEVEVIDHALEEIASEMASEIASETTSENRRFFFRVLRRVS